MPKRKAAVKAEAKQAAQIKNVFDLDEDVAKAVNIFDDA